MLESSHVCQCSRFEGARKLTVGRFCWQEGVLGYGYANPWGLLGEDATCDTSYSVETYLGSCR
jgi:hypothetical protein